MARVEWIERRLRDWAHWLDTGDDGTGYPAMSVLHPEWSPPSPGTTPTLKVAAPSSVRETHRAIGQLSQRLANTLVVHYCQRLPVAEQARRLECQENTLHARINSAHVQLRTLLAAG